MTRKQMKDQVINWIGLQDISAFDETAMVDNLLYWGTIDLLSRTRCTVRCVDLRVQANVDEYTLDHSILALVDVENGLQRVNRSSDFQPSFTLVRSDVLLFKPAPAADGQVQVWGVLRPTPMTADTDSPAMDPYGAVPDEYHDAIVLYALWKAADYSDDASSQQSERYRMLYEGQDGRGGRLGQIRTMVNKRGTSRPPKRRVRGLRTVQSYTSWVG